MKKISLILVLSIVLSVFVSCGSNKTDTPPQPKADTAVTEAADSNKTKPSENSFGAFSTVDINGTAYDETMFGENKLTLVNFCTSWCNPCAAEMPSLGELAKKYKGKVGFAAVVLDIPSENGNISKAAALSEKADNAFPFLLASDDLAQGMGAGVTNVPTTYFVDENGEILDGPYVGARSSDDWTSIIDGYLDKMN